MATETKIEWAQFTVNTHIGCDKIKSTCKNCYAKTMAGRFPKTRGLWGKNAPKIETKSWKKKLASIHRHALKTGRRVTVFMNSMSDIFDDADTKFVDENRNPVTRTIDDIRGELLVLIAQYQEIDFLLLTQRPKNIPWNEIPGDWENLWIGVSIGNQAELQELAPWLLINWHGNRFLSFEPLLGKVFLQDYEWPHFQWIIAGGESGPKARPTELTWLRSLQQQCIKSKVPFFFKQWGNHDADGKRVRSKSLSGRLLDGVECNGVPRAFYRVLE